MDNLKVLVVDDEPGIRSGIERVLLNFTVGYSFMDADFSFTTITAETGELALEILQSQPIDIVLLDNMLPGLQGIDVLDHISKNNIDVLVMMITSYASIDLAIKATNNGAYNFMPKPFTPQELKAAMENMTKHLILKRLTSKMKGEDRDIKFQFLSILSHELKSPINAIEGYLKIMQDRQVGDNISDYENMIDRSLERIKGMRSLILDLLDITKIESGIKTRHVVKLDPGEVLKNCIEGVLILASQRNISIHHEIQDNVYVNSATDEMSIIFNNLLTNAVKYNKEGGEVQVQLKKECNMVVIHVSDTGIGMSSEEVDKLFTEFVRIKNSKTQNISGSGLGLSIVKKMVDLNHGTIEVKSTPDKGSRFTICLPAEDFKR